MATLPLGLLRGRLKSNVITILSEPQAGLDWVAAHAVRPAVATLSLGLLGGAWSRALDAAATALVRDHNVTLVAAAGNGCIPQAPAAATSCRGINAGATDNVKVPQNMLMLETAAVDRQGRACCNTGPGFMS